MRATALIAAIVLGALAPGMALADDDDDCKVPMAQWQPREVVEQMARARGWTVGRIKVDDGCYEIRGQDEAGRAIEAKVDPASLAVIRVKQRGERRSPGPAPTAAPPSNGLFEGGAAPKVEVR